MSTLSTIFRSVARHSHRFETRVLTAPKRSYAINDEYKEGIDSMMNVLKESEPKPAEPSPHINITSLNGLNSMRLGQFHKPYRLTVKGMQKKDRLRKRPKLGPDAAESRYHDVFYQLDIDPLDECMNAGLLSEFVTEMGKIKGRAITGLTWRSQRRLSKAIRRAKMMGIMPVLSKARPTPYM